MNKFEDDGPGFLEECYCATCHGIFHVPSYGDGCFEMELSHPTYCCFCGVEFNWIEEC